jgi:DNA polymerase III delta prime subunit
MTSYLIASSDKQKRELYAKELCTKSQIDQFDITVLALEIEEKSKKTAIKQSIGIEEIKQLQKKLYLKPVRSPQKAIIIKDAQLLTTEAQNAMLKILEEPPEQTIILLTTDSIENLLPTILSRCSIFVLEEEKREVHTQDREEINSFYASIETFTTAQALEYAEKIGKSKADAVAWLEKAILIIRETQLLTNPESMKQSAPIIKRIRLLKRRM